MGTLALKEWAAIVDSLGKGRQSIILRKGGIAENGGEFSVESNRFLLFPTTFHEAPQHIKESWMPYLNGDRFFMNGKMKIEYYAEIAHTELITDWSKVQKLNNWHAWKESTIEERFNRWNQSIYMMVVQVFQLNAPIILDANLPQYSGCKSWIEIEETVTLNGKEVINKTII